MVLSGPSNFGGTINVQTGTLTFTPASGATSTYSGVISGGSIRQNGAGTTILTGNNTYTGMTTISNGSIQADSGVGLPTASFLSLDGGVLQGNAAGTFTRSLSAAGAGCFSWTANGGGFAAGTSPLTVQVNNGTGALTWGSTVGSQIVGLLVFGSSTAANVVTFQNGINLNGADRTIQVVDNTAILNDYAVLSGQVTNGTGTAGVVKTGTGLLLMTVANNYNGATTISNGALQADSGVGIPSASLVVLDGGVYQSNSTYTFTRALGTGGNAVQWTANGGGFAASSLGPLTVNIGGGTLTWGAGVGSGLMGTLKFGSPSAANPVTFQNSLNLGGANRTIFVDDNASSSSDYATVTGVISNSSGTAGLEKTGPGLLVLRPPTPTTAHEDKRRHVAVSSLANGGPPVRSAHRRRLPRIWSSREALSSIPVPTSPPIAVSRCRAI